MRKRLWVLMIVFTLCLQGFSTVFYVSKDGDDANYGRRWNDSFKTITRALQRAERYDQIWVAKGAYFEGDTLEIPWRFSVYGGFYGYEKSLDERIFYQNPTIINGNVDYCCVINHGKLDGFIVQRGFGGVENHGTLSNCIITKNYSYLSVAGVENSGRMENCIISSNRSIYNVGGIENSGTVINCTVYGNRTSSFGRCGGITHKEGFTLNTISWGNIGGDIDYDFYGYSGDVDYCCFGENDEIDGEHNIHLKPFLCSDENNTGWDFHLPFNSPCIGTGTISFTNQYGNTKTAPDTDFDGENRLNDSKVDIGAYEWAPGPKAQFYAERNHCAVGEPLSFSDLSIGEAQAWYWDFDGDGHTDSTEKNPVWYYQNPGLYSVSLRVEDEEYENIRIINDYISVGQVYHVRKGGSDNQSGLNWLEAYQSLSKAISVVKPGDSVWIAHGTYQEFNTPLVIPEGVSVFGGFIGKGDSDFYNKTEDTSIIDGMNLGCCIENNGWLEQISVVNSGRIDTDICGGIFNWGTVNNCKVSFCNGNIAGGIYNFETVINCSVSNCQGLYAGGISNRLGSIQNCNVNNNIARITGGIKNEGGLILKTSIYSNRGETYGGIINLSGRVTNSLIYGNRGNSSSGMYNTGDVKFCTVFGNIYYGGVSGGSGIRNSGTIYNSIVWGHERNDIYGGKAEFCCFLKSEEVEGSNNIEEAPSFISTSGDTASWNLHLNHDSPCIDMGSELYAVEDDFNNVTRPQFTGYDIGAYEYTGDLNSDFIADCHSGQPGFSVQFTAIISNTPDRFEWDFDSDGTIDSTSQNPEYIFSSPGYYSVSLNVYHGDAIETIVKEDFIYVGTCYYVSLQGNDDNNGLSWDEAFLSIDYALKKAYSSDQIWVTGQYYPLNDTLVIPEKVSLYGGFSGNETSLEHRSGVTIIDGIGTVRCVSNFGTLDGFTVSNGKSEVGAGIYNCHGTVSNCTVTRCSAEHSGAGIYNNSGRILNCTLNNNDSAYLAGGIYNDLGIIESCLCKNNTAREFGAGIYNAEGTVNNSKVYQNGSVDSNCFGSGIYNLTGTVQSCLVTSNIGGSGAGIYNNGGFITCSRIQGNLSNLSGNNGAGVFILSNGVLENSLVIGNQGVENGGVYIYRGTVRNCTLYGNKAQPYGGIYCNYGSVLNTISWGNSEMDIFCIANSSNTEVSSCCYENGINISGEFNITENPRFIQASNALDNGCFQLRQESPCIDTGGSENAPDKDFDGNLRPEGMAIDIGAYEFKNTLKALFSTDKQGGLPLLDITFSDGSIGDPDRWEWDFNGDGIIDSTIQNPSFSYIEPGNYSVSLNVYNGDLNDKCTKEKFITVGQTYFVAKQGDDQNNGLSWANAFSSISRALEYVQPYDNIYIAGGSYIEKNTIIVPEKVSVYGGFQGFEESPIQRNTENQITCIDGNDAHRCIINYGYLNKICVSKGYAFSGAGIYNIKGTLDDCDIARNSAQRYGGGLYNLFGTAMNCRVFKNIASGYYNGYGGGIYNRGQILSCDIFENHAQFSVGDSDYSYGGGIYQDHGLISHCRIYNNKAYKGGGLFASDSTSNNCSFRKNYADYGGGVYLSFSIIENCTVAFNDVYFEGGGIYCENSFARNCIAWYNDKHDLYFDSTSDSNTVNCCYELSEDDSGTGNIHTAPLFFLNEESEPYDLHLQAASPCIDAGNDQFTSDYDLDGVPRPQGNHCDIGAYEWSDSVSLDLYSDKSIVRRGELLTFFGYASIEPDLWEWDFDSDGIVDAYGELASYVYPTSGWYSVTLKITKNSLQEQIVKQAYIYVTSRYHVSLDGNNENSGLSWNEAFQSIEYAIEFAASYDEIWVKEGSYSFSDYLHVPEKIFLCGGFIEEDLWLGQRDLQKNASIIDGLNDHMCVKNNGFLDGFSIVNGLCNSYYYPAGGIYNEGTIIRCSVSNNKYSGTKSGAGGIYNRGEVSHCIIRENDDKGVYNYASGKMSQSLIMNNVSKGIYNNGDLYHCTVFNHKNGTGIHNYYGGVLNCISWNNDPLDISASSYYGEVAFSCYEKGSNVFPHLYNICGNPEFLDPFSDAIIPDLRLKSTSPCIDSGQVLFGTVSDLDGNLRPHGNGFDMGCYERTGDFQVRFYSDEKAVRIGTNVHFFDDSIGNIDSWQWDLNGDGIIDSTEKNPSYSYTEPGYYNVSLTVSDQGDSKSLTKQEYIYIGTRFYVKKEGDDLLSGLNWNEALASIQKAIVSSNDSDEIWVAAGIYQEEKVLSIPENVSIYGGFSGSETTITQRDSSNCKSIVDGQSKHACFLNDGIIDGFVVVNGISQVSGAGIYNNGSVRKCVIKKCGYDYSNYESELREAFSGGGVYNNGLTENSLILNNNAEKGGGIYNTETGLVSNCTLTKNTASSGAGIFNSGQVINTIIWRNLGEDLIGGTVLYSDYETGNAEVELSNLHLDPQFINPDSDCSLDYQLRSESPCIDVGQNENAPGDDFTGNVRPENDVVDMGFSESNSNERALFYSDIQVAVTGSRVQFYNASSGEITGFEWDFNGDGITDSIEENPSYIYAEAGDYSVSLTIYFSQESFHCLKQDYIYIGNIYHVATDGDDLDNGLSWSHSLRTINKALSLAKYGDQIWVTAGEFSEALTIPSEISVLGSFMGTEQNSDQRIITELSTVLNGNNEFCCIENYGYLNGIHLKNGYDSSRTGGGLKNYGITDNCEISQCRSLTSGGGVLNMTYAIIRNSKIHNNITEEKAGGIWNQGELYNCEIFENISNSGFAGGLYNLRGTIESSAIHHNISLSFSEDFIAAGIYNDHGKVLHCRIFNNRNDIQGNIFETMASKGGGIFTIGGLIDSCSVYNNTNETSNYSPKSDSYGAGIYCEESMLINCTVFKNHSLLTYTNESYSYDWDPTSYGVGVYLQSGTMMNCTLFRNYNTGRYHDCYSSGSVYLYDGLVRNSIIYGGNGIVRDSEGSGSIEYSCFSFSSYYSEEFPTCINNDPCFMNTLGEPDALDFRLKRFSPCIDSANSENAPGIDLDGYVRPFGTGIDMGAYEFHEAVANHRPIVFLSSNQIVLPYDYSYSVCSLSFNASDVDGEIQMVEYRINGGEFVAHDDLTKSYISFDSDLLAQEETLVEIRAMDSTGTYSDIVSTIITQHEEIQVDFTSDITYGAAPLTVSFQDLSTGDPSDWEWYFDDNSWVDSEEQNPVFTFEEPGTYSVKMLAFHGKRDKKTIEKEALIHVLPADLDDLQAYYIEIDFPEVIDSHTHYSLIVQFENMGTEPWLSGDVFKLGAVGDSDPLAGSLRYELTEDVYFGEIAEFTIDAYALKDGLFTSDWRMLKEGVCWFGETFELDIEVRTQTAVQDNQWSMFE